MSGNKLSPEEHIAFLASQEQDEQQERTRLPRARTYNSAIQYAAFAIIVILLIIDIFVRVHNGSPACPAWERSQYLVGNGTSHELPTSREVMTYSPRNMTGLYEYSTTTKRLTRKNDSDVEYFGPPTQELNEAWEDLLRHDLNILLEDEIRPYHHLREIDRWPPEHKFRFEPEVYHVLHCLNAVRQHVNRVIYPEITIAPDALERERVEFSEITDNWQRLHIEHCMDRIRQDIMCHADMTPSTFYGIDDLPIPLVLGKSSERICRDWEPVRRWTEDRKEVDRQAKSRLQDRTEDEVTWTKPRSTPSSSRRFTR